MPSLTLKSIPDELYGQLKARAAAHRRSLSSEILVCLERAVAVEPADPQKALALADVLRERLQVPLLTDARLRAAKETGRP